MNVFWFQEFYNLDSLSLLEVVDLVETTRDVVDDVWRQTEHDHYPESRMLHLLDIIGIEVSFFLPPSLPPPSPSPSLCVWCGDRIQDLVHTRQALYY